jgi:hypothetical protein
LGFGFGVRGRVRVRVRGRVWGRGRGGGRGEVRPHEASRFLIMASSSRRFMYWLYSVSE